MGISPVIMVESKEATFAATYDEFVFWDGVIQRVRLKDISKVQTSGGILKIFSGEKMVFSTGLQGFSIEELRDFFENLKPLVQSAKVRPESGSSLSVPSVPDGNRVMSSLGEEKPMRTVPLSSGDNFGRTMALSNDERFGRTIPLSGERITRRPSEQLKQIVEEAQKSPTISLPPEPSVQPELKLREIRSPEPQPIESKLAEIKPPEIKPPKIKSPEVKPPEPKAEAEISPPTATPVVPVVSQSLPETPTEASEPVVEAKPVRKKEKVRIKKETPPADSRSEMSRLINSLRLMSLLVAAIGVVFAVLHGIQNPGNLIYSFWIFLSGVAAALLLFVFSGILKILMEILNEVRRTP